MERGGGAGVWGREEGGDLTELLFVGDGAEHQALWEGAPCLEERVRPEEEGEPVLLKVGARENAAELEAEREGGGDGGREFSGREEGDAGSD